MHWQQPHPCSDCFLNCSNLTQSHDTLATSQTAILLFFRKRSFTQSTISFVLLVNGHTESSAPTDVTALLNLENHSKLGFLPVSALQKLSTLVSFQSIFIQIKAKYNAVLLVFQVCHFLRMVTKQMAQHTFIFHKILLNN